MALLIIAAMAMASYMLLQQMMGAQQHDQALLSLVSTQKALSQRVVFLANAADDADATRQAATDRLAARRRPPSSRRTTICFSTAPAPTPLSPARIDPTSIESVLFAKPFHLDYFSMGLAANGWRFISAARDRARRRTQSGRAISPARSGRSSTRPSPTRRLPATANSAQRIERYRRRSGSPETLNVHRTLFYATIGVIILVALFIFRPMSDVILRRTHELVDARNSMAFIAVHDGLTGLHNRTFLTDHFDTLIKGAHRRGERLAVLQLDLDRFKQINDTLGHAAGDYVLVVTAQRMRDSCRASDLCVRLGGDEFVMILSGAGTGEDINCVAKRILARINEPINFHGATILPGASAGIAVYPVDADNAKDLIVHADLALYSAKKHGGGGFSFFSEELRQELEHRKQLERDLKIAIAERTFSVYYQPQVSLTNGAITGVEALVRWNHAQRGMISPGEFIPVAEKSRPDGADRPHHRRQGDHRSRRMAPVPASSSDGWRSTSLAPSCASRISTSSCSRRWKVPACRRRSCRSKSSNSSSSTTRRPASPPSCATSAPPACISSSTISAPATPRSATSIRNEIDRLKIDRRFVQNINVNGDNTKIVRAITELARGLGISIIAEGRGDRGRAQFADVDRLRPGAGLFHRLPDARQTRPASGWPRARRRRPS